MKQDQWNAILECIDENIAIEEDFGLKPRFKDFKSYLLYSITKGKTVEELDWYTIDAVISEMYTLLLKDYAVYQVRKNGL
jgi:hypothetical protein